VVGGFADTEPKTDAANRTISLTTHAIASLRNHRTATLEQRIWLGEVWQGDGDGYVFPNQVGGQLQHSTVERAFAKLIKRADLPLIRFHDLRHTAASLLLNAGVEVTEVERILGHSSPHITYKIYAHCIPGADRQTVVAMERILSARQA
jgi:integrase